MLLVGRIAEFAGGNDTSAAGGFPVLCQYAAQRLVIVGR